MQLKTNCFRVFMGSSKVERENVHLRRTCIVYTLASMAKAVMKRNSSSSTSLGRTMKNEKKKTKNCCLKNPPKRLCLGSARTPNTTITLMECSTNKAIKFSETWVLETTKGLCVTPKQRLMVLEWQWMVFRRSNDTQNHNECCYDTPNEAELQWNGGEWQ